MNSGALAAGQSADKGDDEQAKLNAICGHGQKVRVCKILRVESFKLNLLENLSVARDTIGTVGAMHQTRAILLASPLQIRSAPIHR